jgi:hypothetical protein
MSNAYTSLAIGVFGMLAISILDVMSLLFR